MWTAKDGREPRVLQEAREEAREEVRQRYLEEKIQSIQLMADLKIAPNDIARILRLDIDLVCQELAKNGA